MGALHDRRERALDAHRRGELVEAERRYRELLADRPDDGETWHYLAVLRGQQERHADALACCDEAIRCGYRTAAVYANKGLAHRALADAGNAIPALGESLALDPADAELTLEYVALLRATGAEQEALAALGDACARFAGDPRFFTELGRLAAEVNEGQRAENAFRRALALDDASAERWLNLGNVLQMRGDGAAANECYRSALSFDPDVDAAYWYLAQAGAAADDAALATAIVTRAAAPSSTEILFAAGTVQHEAGRTDAAFEAWAAGNGLVRRSYDYSVDADIETLRELTTRLATTDSSALQPAELQGLPQPVFIVGLPRSGSTLLEQMLAGHPSISAGGEIVWLQRYLRHALRERRLHYPAAQLRLDDAALLELRRRYVAALALRAKGATRVTDKLPANFLCIPVIRRLFPRALIVHARRDPLETCWSCYRHLFSGTQNFAYDLAELGRYCRAATHFIDACRRRWPDHVVELHYERLIGNPEQEMRRLLRHLVLEWDARCLAPGAAANVVMTASAAQVRGGLAGAPRGSAGPYARYLGPLRAALDAAV